MTRGELWWADFGLPFGSEPGYRRPVLILQNDLFNNSKISTTVVIPLTTNLLLAEAPGNIFVKRKESKLIKDSVVAISQIGVIDRRRLIEKITALDGAIIKKVEDGIMFILGIKKFP
jgi:mRNA interferase MazF